jgi:hypothetical protein
MIPLQVAWYLPLPIPSNKRMLTTHKLTCKIMSSPSEVVAWECGACAYTNKDATRRNCILFQTRRQVCYAIVAGATAAVTARTTRVDCHEQACVATLATAAPAIAWKAPTAASGAVAGEAPTAASEAIAEEALTAANGPPAVAKSVPIPSVQAPGSPIGS